MHRTATTRRMTGIRRREALDSLAKIMPAMWRSQPCCAAPQSELSRLFDAVSAAGAPSGRSLIRDTNDVRVRGQVLLHTGVAEASQRRRTGRRAPRRHADGLAQPPAATGGSCPGPRVGLVARRLRSGAGQFHDGDHHFPSARCACPTGPSAPRYIYTNSCSGMGRSRLFEVTSFFFLPRLPRRQQRFSNNILVAAHVLGHAVVRRTIWSSALKNRAASTSSSTRRAVRRADQARYRGPRLRRRRRGSGRRTRRWSYASTSIAACATRSDISICRGRPHPPMIPFVRVSATVDSAEQPLRNARRNRAPLPPHPENNNLWFIATYAPDMESWERDIFHTVGQK